MNKKRFREKTLPATIMVGQVTLWLILLVAVPLIYILVMSFCSIDQYYNVTFQFTFDNYKHLVDSSYIKIYVQSLVIALLTTVICIVLAYPFTYIIARTKSRSKNLLYMLVIIPFWTNSLIRILWMEDIPWFIRLVEYCAYEAASDIRAIEPLI